MRPCAASRRLGDDCHEERAGAGQRSAALGEGSEKVHGRLEREERAGAGLRSAASLRPPQKRLSALCGVRNLREIRSSLSQHEGGKTGLCAAYSEHCVSTREASTANTADYGGIQWKHVTSRALAGLHNNTHYSASRVCATRPRYAGVHCSARTAASSTPRSAISSRGR